MLAANPMALTGADQALTTNAGQYLGFSIRETTGTTSAAVRIYDNASAAAGTLLDTISLDPGESVADYYPGGGIRFVNGLFVKIVSGAIEGSVRIG